MATAFERHGRYQAREFRQALKAHLRAGNDLRTLSEKTSIPVGELERLRRGQVHWVSGAAARALLGAVRVPVVTEFPELVVGVIPVSVLRPYVEKLITDAGGISFVRGAADVSPRRTYGLRGQLAVSAAVADRIVCAAEGPQAFFEDERLRRFWWASEPSAVLRTSSAKRIFEREAKRRREAREPVAV